MTTKPTRLRLSNVVVSIDILTAHPRVELLINAAAPPSVLHADGRQLVYHLLEHRPELKCKVRHRSVSVHVADTDELVGRIEQTYSRRSGGNAFDMRAEPHPDRERSDERMVSVDWKRCLRYALDAFVPMTIHQRFKTVWADGRPTLEKFYYSAGTKVSDAAHMVDPAALVTFLRTCPAPLPPELQKFVAAYTDATELQRDVRQLRDPKNADVALTNDAVLVRHDELVACFALDAVPHMYSNALAIRLMPLNVFIPNVGLRMTEHTARIFVKEQNA